MLVCINCGRSFENAKYCMFCGTLLRKKIVNYETSGTLLRSNLNPESVNPILSASVNNAVQEEQKKTAFCASAADSIGSVDGTAPDLLSQANQLDGHDIYSSEKNDSIISTPHGGLELSKNDDSSEIKDKIDLKSDYDMRRSESDNADLESKSYESGYVDMSSKFESEQPEETDDQPIEEDIGFDDFMTRMDGSALSDETESPESQAIDHSDEENEISEPQEIEVTEVEVETSEPESEQHEKITDVHDNAASLMPQSTTSGDIDPMFGEPPKINYTVFDPESSVQSAKPMSWIERLKRKNKRK